MYTRYQSKVAENRFPCGHVILHLEKVVPIILRVLLLVRKPQVSFVGSAILSVSDTPFRRYTIG